jgi:hypothetical protein
MRSTPQHRLLPVLPAIAVFEIHQNQCPHAEHADDGDRHEHGRYCWIHRFLDSRSIPPAMMATLTAIQPASTPISSSRLQNLRVGKRDASQFQGTSCWSGRNDDQFVYDADSARRVRRPAGTP